MWVSLCISYGQSTVDSLHADLRYDENLHLILNTVFDQLHAAAWLLADCM